MGVAGRGAGVLGVRVGGCALGEPKGDMVTTTVLDRPIAVPAPIAQPDEIEVVIALRHIEQGVRGNSRRCAVALALKEDGYVLALGGCGISTVQIGRVIYDVPRDMGAWITAFDFGSPVAPERFRLVRRASGAS